MINSSSGEYEMRKLSLLGEWLGWNVAFQLFAPADNTLAETLYETLLNTQFSYIYICLKWWNRFVERDLVQEGAVMC
jgi:hypothetical protein